MEMLRLGAVGAGSVFAAYDEAAAALPDVELVAVADPDRRKLGNAACPGRQLLASAAELLEIPLDAVLILTPNSSHGTLVRAWIANRLDVLCEKPLATTAAEARALERLSTAAGTFLYPAMHCRHRPEIRYLRDKLRGNIVFFSQVYRENWISAPDWYFDRAQSGGGVLLDVGSNQIDWILPLVRSLTVEAVHLDFAGAAVEFDCHIEWTCATGRGRTELSWRAEAERKATRVVTDRGDVFELDHDRHLVVHNGKKHGPWRNTEWAEVLEDFRRRRRDRTPAAEPAASELLALLRDVYAKAGHPFLRSNA